MAGQSNRHGPSESVVFNGYTYRRYPLSPRRDLRVYFSRSGGRYLHRAIWEDAHGKRVPRGHHVHHADGDTPNNSASNLEIILATDHQIGGAVVERVSVRVVN